MPTKPKDIKLKNVATLAKFKPNGNNFITSHMDGRVRIYEYFESRKPKRRASIKIHPGPVRSFVLDETSQSIFSCCDEKTVRRTDLETIQVMQDYTCENDDLACLYRFSEKILVSTSNDGQLTIFDTLSSKIIKKIDIGETFTCMIGSDGWKTLMYCSSEGFLHAYSLKNWRLLDKSDLQEDEYTCGAIISANKVLFGSSQKGRFCVYNRNEWGNPSDILYTSTSSIDHVEPIDESTLVFTALDGFVGSYHTYPSYLAGYYCKRVPSIITSCSVSTEADLLMISHEDGLSFWSLEQDLLSNTSLKKSSKRQNSNNMINRIQSGNFFSDL
ncbi:WD repeat-containing protein 55 [Thelohanellus kitauei]|uniref:WD repeat-containing protein 55 n=1 Tax=Thelohanellus kitauei TaxID=669202 RepID=A0A0C2MLY1_THEKT|nr:WD repeat-containing protein 55 [Thelohanellus kitauei]